MSYDPRDVHQSTSAEITRLAVQVDATWEREAELLTARGAPPGGRWLDLGAGPGFWAEHVLERWPQAHVTAMEPDTDLRLAAEDLLEEFDDRAACVDGALPNTMLSSRSWDVVVARYLFQHLAAPKRAAEEMRRLLRPGGLAVVIDVDSSLGPVLDPPLPAYTRAAAQLAEHRRVTTTSQQIGRRLPRLLTEAGFESVRVDALVLHSGEVGLGTFRHQLDVGRMMPLVRSGAVQREHLDRLRGEVDEWMQRPESTVIQVGLVVTARRRERRGAAG